ncbi:MAG TPA: aldehyde dehydrogenase [Magnetospirillaceae bacterium]|jgi:acyl-CoA reductase-like NAD-dependent aldehyde dehydrogenase
MKSMLIIDNKAVNAASGATFDRADPITGDVVTQAAAATVEDARAAVDSAARAFPAWSRLGPNRRRDILLQASTLLHDRTEDFTDLMMAETGAAAPWVSFNVHLAASMLREAASLTTHIKGEVIPGDKPGMMAMAIRRPAGVVLSIAPWNAPIILAVRAFATALACGNTVVLKASELSPGTQFLLVETMRDAGLPPGVLNLITNAPADAGKIVETMIAHPAVRRVNFTGSTKTGKLVAETCARYLKPALLELGGKAPMLVLEDADIDNAVRAAAFGAFMHQGQICMSTERIVVDTKIADVFASKLAAKAGTMAAGNPRTSNVPLGSMIGRDAATRADGLVKDAVAKGAKLLAGGSVDGTFMSATVLDRVTPEMRVYYEESFAPMACLVRVKDADDAVRVANDTEYGLSSSIFTNNVKLALELASRLDFGCCHINGPTVHDEAQMPLGGMKASGYGRFGGQPGINEFTEVQWVSIEDPNQPYPI